MFLFWGWVYGPFGALLVRVVLKSSQATGLHAGLMTSVDEPEIEEAPSDNGASSSALVMPGLVTATDNST